ncbi:MAG: LytTR family DNA-binding domain-containing protein [Bacteroidia bacterium]|nr:LytTR family DNA-binding domain-containing protein [Bacteroidia bacterium]
MKAFLVENEKNLREVLKKLLQIHCPEVEVVGEADSVTSALEAIPQHEFDLLFLDIEMDDGTGLDLLSQLKKRSFHVIFVTAYDKYAIHAFRFSAIDYLLKPVDPDALESAIAKVKELQQKEMETQQLNALIQNLNPPNGRRKKIVVNDKSNLFFIDLEDVYYLQARGAYTEICLKDKVIFTSKNLKNYEEILLDAGFVRTHNSYIVNLSHVVKLNKSDNLLELKNNKSVSVSARKKDVLISEMKRYTMF